MNQYDCLIFSIKKGKKKHTKNELSEDNEDSVGIIKSDKFVCYLKCASSYGKEKYEI